MAIRRNSIVSAFAVIRSKRSNISVKYQTREERSFPLDVDNRDIPYEIQPSKTISHAFPRVSSRFLFRVRIVGKPEKRGGGFLPRNNRIDV